MNVQNKTSLLYFFKNVNFFEFANFTFLIPTFGNFTFFDSIILTSPLIIFKPDVF